MSIAEQKILVEKAKVRVSRETAYNALMAGESMFSAEIAESICLQIAQGKSLRQICEVEGMPAPSTVCFWIQREDLAPGFAEQYARARKSQAELMLDEILTLADDKTEDSNSRRLRVDTRKWIMSKVLPKIYGDAMQLKHADHEGNAMHVKVTRVKGRED